MKESPGVAEVTREQLIFQAALIEFADNGYAGTSLQNIAVRAGVAKSLIFHHYKSKKNLYLTVLRQAYNDLLESVRPYLTLDLPYVQTVLAAGNAKLRFFVEHPHHHRLIYRAMTDHEPDVIQEIMRIFQEQYQFVEQYQEIFIRNLPLREGIGKDEALQLVMAVLEKLQQNLILKYRGRFNEMIQDNEAIWNEFFRYLNIIFYGILAEPLPDMEPQRLNARVNETIDC